MSPLMRPITAKQGAKKYGPNLTNESIPNYHANAQAFIKSAKAKNMTVKAEGNELIAYPPKMKQNMQSMKGRPNIRYSK
jgi:hypothetical protein